MANYLVTGGGGFIGSNIVEHLVEHGESVRVLENFSTGRRENLASVLSRIELIEGDILDAATCERATEDMDYVLHEAALPSVPRSIEDPIGSAAINVMGTVNMLHAARKSNVARFVMAASSSAYGDLDVPAKREDLLPSPISPYAAGKLAAEYFCKAFHSAYGLETVCLRYFNIFGPRQDPDSPYGAVVPIFVKMMLAGKSPTIHGDGLQTRDFTYVENAVHANILAVRAGADAVGGVFNVACGKSFALLDLVERINEALGTKIVPHHVSSRKGDVRHSRADIAAAHTALRYEPTVDFNEGIRRTIEWHRGKI